MTQETLRYSRTAMFLHWAIALLLVFNFGLGERTEDLREGPELFWIMQLHKSVGITILLLSVWRLGLRLATKRPAKVADGPVLQALSAAVHWGFYAVMIIVPLSGWVLVSTAKVQLPTMLFGVVPWPHLPNMGHDVHETAEEVHEILAKIMIPLLALHIIGALRHQFLIRDALVERMVPARRVTVIGFAVLLATLAFAFVSGKNLPAPLVASVGEPLPDFQSAKSGEGRPAAPSVEKVEAKRSPEEAPRAAETIAAPVSDWKVKSGGQLGFAVRVNGEQVRGHFGQWSADIRFDPARLDQSSINATIALASARSGDDGRDAMLQGESFFGTAQPVARFTANRIRAQGDRHYRADGSLRLKGVSHPVSVAFSLAISGDTARAQGTARLDRRDFGVGTDQFAGTDMIASDVNVDFAFEAQRLSDVS